MMPNEVIVLAGGKGTRLSHLLGDIPKCMAPIGQQPFLYYLIRNFQEQGASKFIFSLGVGHEKVCDYLSGFAGLDYHISLETEPLGTGGAVARALELCENNTTWVTNGDSFLDAVLPPMVSFHHMCGSDCTIALTEVDQTDRYGSIQLDHAYRVTSFKEKGQTGTGWINAGIYLLNKRAFSGISWPASFSFERDYLQHHMEKARFFGYRYKDFFIDIGTHEDFHRAQNELIKYAT
jgi:D-glycero-alpha-D-manno-heptose 1-phosphate guanylyltransferase